MKKHVLLTLSASGSNCRREQLFSLVRSGNQELGCILLLRTCGGVRENRGARN
jgi:hypothetical protein